MQIPKNQIRNGAFFVVVMSLIALASMNIRSPKRSEINWDEHTIQRSIDILADLSSGREKIAKSRLEIDLKFALKNINTIAQEKTNEGERAKVVQKVVSKWRADNPSIILGPELEKEIQIASSQNR